MARSWMVTKEELTKGDLASVGWHQAEIIKYESGEAGEQSKNPGSATCTFFFKITDDGVNNGKQCKRLFSEVAWGFAKNFFATMGYPKDKDGTYQVNEDMFNQSVGHKLMIYTKVGKSNQGNEFTDVADFRPLA